ncbi:MAG: hypothetical protein GY854_04185 [Deltaproteobacteria bacterium]|nr:hypothetical protein [Deltaproteobacteria bacterium]
MKTTHGLWMYLVAGLCLVVSWPVVSVAQEAEDSAKAEEDESESKSKAEESKSEGEDKEDIEENEKKEGVEDEALGGEEEEKDEVEKDEVEKEEEISSQDDITASTETSSLDDEQAWKAGAETEPEPEEVEAIGKPKILQGTWTKKIVFMTDDGSFKFQPRGWVQPRFQLAMNPDADDVTAGSGFSLKRARFGFQAWLFDWARFYLDTGFASGTGKLIDYFVDLNPFDGLVVLRIGHFRPYYCRQLLAATTKLAMIEYAQAWQDKSLGLNLGRDLGAGVHGLLFNGLEYGVGIWNGDRDGDGKMIYSTAGRMTDAGTQIVGNIDYEFGGRIAVHPLALAGVGETVMLGDESDSSKSDRPGLSVGGAIYYNRRHDRIVEAADGVEQPYYDNQLKVGADVAFKYIGLSVQGEFFLLKTSLQDGTPDPVVDLIENNYDGIESNLVGAGFGTYLQVGYFVMPKRLEIVGRFDMVDEDTDLRGTRLYPALGGTYYFFGNNLKAQLMYRLGVGTGYEDTDPGYIPTTHNIFLMFQASI